MAEGGDFQVKTLTSADKHVFIENKKKITFYCNIYISVFAYI